MYFYERVRKAVNHDKFSSFPTFHESFTAEPKLPWKIVLQAGLFEILCVVPCCTYFYELLEKLSVHLA